MGNCERDTWQRSRMWKMMESDGKADMVEGVTYEKVMKAMNKMKPGEAAGLSKVNMDVIMAREKFGVGVIKKLCQRELHGEGMPELLLLLQSLKERGCGGLWGI